MRNKPSLRNPVLSNMNLQSQKFCSVNDEKRRKVAAQANELLAGEVIMWVAAGCMQEKQLAVAGGAAGALNGIAVG